MSDSEFDLEAVHHLIDTVLAPEPPPPARGPALWPTDLGLFPALDRLLADYLSPTQVAEVFGRLRSELVSQPRGELAVLRERIRRCRRCPGVAAPTPGVGNLTDPTVVVVTEAPLSTAGGTALTDGLVGAGFSPSELGYLWAARCRATPLRPPSPTELSSCAGWLAAEIEYLSPSLILPVGAAATASLLGPGHITVDHGKLCWLGPWPVLAVYAPGHVAKAGTSEQWAADLARAYDFVHPR